MGRQRFTTLMQAMPAAVVAAGMVLVAAAASGPAYAATGSRATAMRGGTAAGVISTVAGGVGGPGRGTTVALYHPCGVAFGAGRVLVGDETSVRAIDPATGRLTTPAGSGLGGSAGTGWARKANMVTCGVAVDPSGNLLIADTFHELIRVVPPTAGTFYGQAMKARHIYTVAGDGHFGFSGDGGPATSAELNGPARVVADAAGNLVISDSNNNRIRVVAAHTGTFYGQAMTAGDIYTVAGNGKFGFSGDGGPATSAALDDPVGVAVDAAGNLVIGDAGNGRIRVVAAHTGTFYGQAMTAQDIYTVAGSGNDSLGDGGPATSASLDLPLGVAVDAAGNLLIADTDHKRIRVVAAHTGTFYGQAMTAGDIYTVAGGGKSGQHEGGPATSANLDFPDGVAVDAAGNLVIADTFHVRVRVVAASTARFYGKAMTAGDIYTIAGNGHFEFSGDGGRATSAELRFPHGVSVDAAGDVLITDYANNRVRMVAVSSGTFYGKAMTAGHIYTVAGGGTKGLGDGGPATSAELSNPEGTAADAAGNLLIADSDNGRIRVVAAATGTFYGQAMTAGDIYTIAGDGTTGFSGDGGPATSAEVFFPDGVAVDAAGNVMIADSGNNRIRVVAAHSGTFYGQAMTAGDIYTVAGGGTGGLGDGGPATSAALANPGTVAPDAAGNLVIADLDHNRIRVVAAHTGTFYGQAMTAGDIYTVAGDGVRGFAGNGGPATSAELHSPAAATVDAAGNVVIADSQNNQVRVIAARSGTFYGQPMSAGDIYTVAGKRKAGFSGDGGPATEAKLSGPADVAVNAAGNLLIADLGNNRIRMVTG